MNFRIVLKGLRVSRGLSIRQLSNSSKVSIGAIRKWERGDRWPSEEIIRHLMGVLRIPEDMQDATIRILLEQRPWKPVE